MAWLKLRLEAEASAAASVAARKKRSSLSPAASNAAGAAAPKHKPLDTTDPKVLASLRALAELAKIQLSTEEQVTLRWGFTPLIWA